METKLTISIEVDLAGLASYSNAHLAALWHAVQANPENGFGSKGPGEAAEKVGREVIRRWLRSVEPELWHHQGSHYYWEQLRHLGSWQDGTFVPHTAEPEEDTSSSTESAPSAEAGGA